ADAWVIIFWRGLFAALFTAAYIFYRGTTRKEFLAAAVLRGEITDQQALDAQERFNRHRPFSFDRKMPSGRVVTTNIRPVRDGGSVVTFTDVTKARQGEAELAQAKTKAEEAQIMAQNALVEQEAQQRTSRVLAELDEWLQTCKSLDELFLIVRTFMERVLPKSEGELYIYSNSRDVLDGACAWGHDMLHDHIAPDSCWALRRGRAYTFKTTVVSFSCGHLDDQDHALPPNDFICVPIVAHGDTVGLLHIRFNEKSYADAQIRDPHGFAVQCGEHVSLAIANVKLRDELRDQSTRDPLTGLYNRRYFLEAMRAQISLCERKREQFSLIAFDADKFKSFNDNHGHDAGDMVLRAIGSKLTEIFDDGEIPCRVGGEEFAVIVPHADKQKAIQAAEKMRLAIEAVTIRYGGQPLPTVTISSGIATYPGCGKLPQDLIKQSDEALYQAKADGRNCVRCAEDMR
ncbi:MAG: diguanylate cyclase, partial [Planktomarina sp.]